VNPERAENVTSERKKVVAIAGSLRKGSYNRMLLQAATLVAPPTIAIEVYRDLGTVPVFDEDLEGDTSGGPPGVMAFRAAIREADAVLISTPEYNQSTSGVLKNAIDWLSRPGPDEVLIGKPIGIMGASGGRWGTRLAQANLRQVLTATESIVMPQPAIFVAEASKVFDEQGALKHDLLRQQLQKFMIAFRDWLWLVERRSLPRPADNHRLNS
jgi:chromate reductase